jgi:hypothetical protein
MLLCKKRLTWLGFPFQVRTTLQSPSSSSMLTVGPPSSLQRNKNHSSYGYGCRWGRALALGRHAKTKILVNLITKPRTMLQRHGRDHKPRDFHSRARTGFRSERTLQTSPTSSYTSKPPWLAIRLQRRRRACSHAQHHHIRHDNTTNGIIGNDNRMNASTLNDSIMKDITRSGSTMDATIWIRLGTEMLS